MVEMKDNGKRIHFDTGCIREPDHNKGSFDLLPFLSIIKIAKVMQKGAKKYDSRNWEKGMPLSRFLNSGLRHLIQYTLNFKDEDHLSQAIWNFMCLQETKIRIENGILPKELDDIPSNFFKELKNGFDVFGYLFTNEDNNKNNICQS